MGAKSELTRKQELFCQQYILQKGNGTQAVMAVYDTKDEKAASVIAAENLGKLSIKQRIAELSHKTDKPMMERKDRVIEFLENMAFNDARGTDDRDRIKSAELLGKVEGLFKENVELKGDIAYRIVRGDEEEA